MLRRPRRLYFQQLESRCLLAAVNIPTDLTGTAGGQVIAPINIDSAAGIRGTEIRLRYDTTYLDLSPSAVTAGTVWNGVSDTQVTANVDDSNGSVVIFVSSSAPLSAISGSLARLSFTISSNAPAGTTAALNLTSVVLNEGAIVVNPAPASGSDSTDGLITITAGNGGTSSITGFAYADPNNNQTVDVGEAIPEVVITLTNTTTGTSMQTTTSADGSYRFSNLAAGTYSLVQRQPQAYIEGGVNNVAVTLTVGQSITAQNFREAGLLPQFIYARLLSTTVQPVGSAPYNSTILQINRDAEAGTSSTVATLNAQAAAFNEVVASTAHSNSTVPAGEPMDVFVQGIARTGDLEDVVPNVIESINWSAYSSPSYTSHPTYQDPLVQESEIGFAAIDAIYGAVESDELFN